MRTIPLGTAYAIWTGIGCIGAFIAGILLFGEAFTVSRTVFASLIAIGIILLRRKPLYNSKSLLLLWSS